MKSESSKIRTAKDDDDQSKDLISFDDLHRKQNWIMTFNSLFNFCQNFLLEILTNDLLYLFDIQEIS